MAVRQPAGSAAEGPIGDGLAALRAATAELARVLRAMSPLGSGLDPPDDPPGVTAAVWADDDYLYIEARLSDDLGTCIDVSTCGRTLMVRIARGNDHE